MSSFRNFAWSTMILLAFGVQSNLASPTSSPNITVMVRDENFAYHESEEMANVVLSRNAESSLVKRSHATVQACRTSSCTDCTTVFDGSFVSPSACIPAENTACLIVSNLEDATIWNWNHAGWDAPLERTPLVLQGLTPSACTLAASANGEVGLSVSLTRNVK
ncbi:unnamed protein product [Penicillium crustosum]